MYLCLLAEDQAQEHVQAADAEEQERGHKSELVHAVAQNSRAKQALNDAQGTETEGRREDGKERGEEAVDEREGAL